MCGKPDRRLLVRVFSRLRQLVPLLAASVLLAGALAPAASQADRYGHAPASADGIGKRYMGREIAAVMGWQGAAWLERTEREREERTDLLIEALALRPGMVVADIGAGTGYFAVRLARTLVQGHVWGVDIEPDMVRYLAERARREGLANLSAVLASAADHGLPAPVDLVLVVNTYHHIDARMTYFRNLRGALRPGGSVAIIDFTASSPVGPPREGRVAAGRVKAEMAAAGYTLAQEHALLPYQYFLVFAPVP